MKTALILIGLFSIVTSCVMVAGYIDSPDSLTSGRYIGRGILKSTER